MGFEIGKTVAGYEVVEVLGGSKIGVAYKVRNVFAQRFEVLKILPKGVQDDDEQIARFLREIKVHARLVHPNIVTFYNAREIEGQLVMTTEFVPGITVAERLEVGAIAWRDALAYGNEALAALEYAHASGVIHRGLTASSLVITTDGTIRLSGFGLAKVATDPQLTAVGTVIGALRYISPEQVRGVALDTRCDIYSLGVVLYEMLTGTLPFESKGQFEIMLAHVNVAPKHPSELNPQVPREVGDVVLKAMAKEPDQRFQTAQEFRAAIERLLGNRKEPAMAVGTAQNGKGTAAVAGTNGAMAAQMSAPAATLTVPETNGRHVLTVAKEPAAEPTPLETPRTMAPMAAAVALSSDAEVMPASPRDSGSIFGSVLSSKLGISLVACAVTFILGSVALLAVLAMTKP
jgi:serine/threonine protein kinase